MSIRIKRWSSFCFILLCFFGHCFSQSKAKQNIGKFQRKDTWIKFSPPNKNFVIDFPQRPRHSHSFSSNQKDISPFKCTNSVDSYTVRLKKKQPDYAIVLAVYDVTTCSRTKDDFDNEVEGFIKTIGGDNKELTQDRRVSINGFDGREYSFSVNGYHHRGLIISADKHIYLLMYTTDVEGENTSPKAERIFKSFNLLL